MEANPDTRVWNFSLNQPEACQLDCVSPLGHDIALLARKHKLLPVISIGNKPGKNASNRRDCEAAITVGGRLHGEDGAPAGECPVSLCGPGPSSMLKPELSHFSHVRALGGLVIKGSSFGAALTSPVAAHTMQRVRDASPDLVKALLLHNADGETFDPSLGFGTPAAGFFPWECRPGFVTLQWSASLRPGAAFDREAAHPPIASESVRLATALQYQRGKTPKGAAKFLQSAGVSRH